MGIQLWLLTVALDLYLGGNDNPIWPLPLVSGLIFLGGLLTFRLLNRRRRPPLSLSTISSQPAPAFRQA